MCFTSVAKRHLGACLKIQCILGNRILIASTIWYTKVIFRQDIIIINSKAVKVKAAEAVKPNNSIHQPRIFLRENGQLKVRSGRERELLMDIGCMQLNTQLAK